VKHISTNSDIAATVDPVTQIKTEAENIIGIHPFKAK